MRIIFRISIFFLLLFFIGGYFIYTLLYRSRAAGIKADIVIDANHVIGYMNYNWKALAQGGEEQGVRMLQNVIPQVKDLDTKYIRLDHLYDFYHVVDRDSAGQLTFNWTELDATVCDIYAAGAKPFLALTYMPPAISKSDLVDVPNNWNDWALVVQKTVEHYSGMNTVLCGGQVSGEQLAETMYEVWNEPDLFGKWSIHGGEKDYKTLYSYSVRGASRAQNVRHFMIGGPATTAAYKNWFQVLLKYISQNNLRIDFLSWHHYSPDPEDFKQDVLNINGWLSDPICEPYRHLPKMITEWGYDSNPNPVQESKLGAAHTVATIKNLIDQDLEYAFAFDIKDPPEPRWGILTHEGEKKPRYHVLQFLNLLDSRQLAVEGEGTYVKGIASLGDERVTLILVNFDAENNNDELVPVTIKNLPSGTYTLSFNNMYGPVGKSTVEVTDGTFKKQILMTPNMVVELDLTKNPSQTIPQISPAR